MSRNKILARMESLSDRALPESLNNMNDEQLFALDEWLDQVLEKERAGLDSLFSSMTHTMKFIPNLLLQTLTAKYIEAPIAARITQKLTTKQAVAIANGLKADYVADTTRYMSPQLSAELLSSMQVRKARRALALAMERYPGRAIELMSYLDQKTLSALTTADEVNAMTGEMDDATRDGLLKLLQA